MKKKYISKRQFYSCHPTLHQCNDVIYSHCTLRRCYVRTVADPGTFQFSKPSLIVKESAGKALIPIERSNGCDGTVKLKWKTEDMTATSGKDFEGGEGELVFEHGETSKTLEICIYDDQVATVISITM